MIQQEIQENTNYLKDFVPYKQALELKKLGFDEPCFGYFNKTWSKENELLFPQYVGELENWNNTQHLCSAPTFSQAFRWFREKYGLRNSITDFIDDETGIEWDYEIAIIGTDVDERGNYKPLIDYSTDDETRKFKTYEEAELACLRKLIEIVKQQL